MHTGVGMECARGSTRPKGTAEGEAEMIYTFADCKFRKHSEVPSLDKFWCMHKDRTFFTCLLNVDFRCCPVGYVR
jgi:hypothetical protein